MIVVDNQIKPQVQVQAISPVGAARPRVLANTRVLAISASGHHLDNQNPRVLHRCQNFTCRAGQAAPKVY